MIKRLILISAFLFTVPAFAQEPKEVTLTVTSQELSVIGEALGLVAYAKVAPLMAKLQGQVVKQQPAQGSPVAVPENGK